MAGHKGILVFGDIVEGTLSSNTLEILGCGRRLADQLGERLSCLLVGETVESAAKEAVACGADTVYVAEDPSWKNCSAAGGIDAAESVLRDHPAKIVLCSQYYRDLAARLAFRLGVSLATNCTGLELDAGSGVLKQTRPIYGGKAYAVVSGKKFPQIATVRVKAMSPIARDASRSGQVTRLEVKATPQKTKIVRIIKDEDLVRIEDAKVLVSGGRGVGGPDAFTKLLKPLAEALRGEVSSSRPPVDNGWVSKARLVGITGAIVAPELYVAVGISGTVQHMTGCRNAKTIVAINKDPDAAIFDYADFGVVGPHEEVLPALTRQLTEPGAT